MASLHYVCDCGNADIVKLLIQSKADFELENKVGVVLTIIKVIHNIIDLTYTGRPDRTNDCILERTPGNSDGADQSWS